MRGGPTGANGAEAALVTTLAAEESCSAVTGIAVGAGFNPALAAASVTTVAAGESEIGGVSTPRAASCFSTSATRAVRRFNS